MTGPEDAYIYLWAEGKDVPTDSGRIRSGKYLLQSNPPGKYTVELTTPDGASLTRVVLLEPSEEQAEPLRVEFPK